MENIHNLTLSDLSPQSLNFIEAMCHHLDKEQNKRQPKFKKREITQEITRKHAKESSGCVEEFHCMFQ